MGVSEVWRWKHGQSLLLLFYHLQNIRIDLAFANPSMMSDVIDAMYLPSGISDHCPLLLNIHSPSSCTSALWHLGTYWLYHAELAKIIPPCLAEYWDLNEGSSSP